MCQIINFKRRKNYVYEKNLRLPVVVNTIHIITELSFVCQTSNVADAFIFQFLAKFGFEDILSAPKLLGNKSCSS